LEVLLCVRVWRFGAALGWLGRYAIPVFLLSPYSSVNLFICFAASDGNRRRPSCSVADNLSVCVCDIEVLRLFSTSFAPLSYDPLELFAFSCLGTGSSFFMFLFFGFYFSSLHLFFEHELSPPALSVSVSVSVCLCDSDSLSLSRSLCLPLTPRQGSCVVWSAHC
jgi:hypothetical protein